MKIPELDFLRQLIENQAKIIRNGHAENDLLRDRVKELERALDECQAELDEARDKMGVLADMDVQPNDSH